MGEADEGEGPPLGDGLSEGGDELGWRGHDGEELGREVGAHLGLGQGGGLPAELGQHPTQLPADRGGGQDGLGAGLDPVGVDLLAVGGLLVVGVVASAAAGVPVVASTTSNSVAAVVLQVLSDGMTTPLVRLRPGAACASGARMIGVR
ncbi:MAG TPA: hypothetical protein VGC06_17905 [Actinomycetes bacterium]